MVRQAAPFAKHLGEGLRYVIDQRIILLLISVVAVSAFLSMPYSTLMPVFADRVLKQSAQPVVALLCDGPQSVLKCRAPEALPLGMLLTAIGIGAVVGSLWVASMPTHARRGGWLTVGNLAFPALLIGFALSRSFLLSLVLLVGVGMSFVAQNALANTLIQIIVPDEVRGRVMSLYTLTFQVMMRAGGLQAGLLADSLGPTITVAGGAVVSLLYGLFIALRHPRLRKMA
jgi:hypothetical protein